MPLRDVVVMFSLIFRRYHTACEKIGKLYAFEKPMHADSRDVAADMGERRQIARYVRDLKAGFAGVLAENPRFFECF